MRHPSTARILVVDDEPLTLKLASHFLSKNQYEVVCAASGQAALETLNTDTDFDLVLLDMMMPEVSGLDVLQRIKNDSQTRDIKVIMLTAMDQPSDLAQAFQTGVDDYVTKPFNAETLLARIKSQLRLRQHEQKLQRQNRYLASLNLLATDLMSQLDIRELLKSIVYYVCDLVETQDGYIITTGEEMSETYLGMGAGRFADVPDLEKLRQRDFLLDDVWKRREAEAVENYSSRGSSQPGLEWIHSYAAFPLFSSEQRVVGVLGLVRDRPPFIAEEINILVRFSQLVSIALENARLHTRARVEIEERRRVQEELRYGEAHLRSIIEALPDVVILYDEDGHYDDIQVSSDNLLYASLDEMKGHLVHEILPEIPADTILDAIRHTIETNQNQVVEYQLDVLSGTRWFEAHLSPLPVQQGEKRKVVFLAIDVTKRREMEAEMVAMQKMVGIGTLAAGMAHEINSPLQVITGFTGSVLRDIQNNQLDVERLRSSMEAIDRNAWRVAGIVRAVQEYARPSTDEMAEISLNQIVQNTLLTTQETFKKFPETSIRLELQENLPLLVCDQDKLQQALTNLLFNARDAMPGGGEIVVRSGYQMVDKQLWLSVSDTGTGIPEDIQEKIFDPFFTTKPLKQGVGLGLAIVSGVARAHGGRIEVQSQTECGATFTLYFPEDRMPKKTQAKPGMRARFDDSV